MVRMYIDISLVCFINDIISSRYTAQHHIKVRQDLFDTPTFDRITKDRAAKFSDMLSAIGGTMGLLTGFSIISGVEILYFASKIIINVFWKNNK